MSSKIKNNLALKLDRNIHKMTGEQNPYYRLFSLDIDKIYHCPYCAKRFIAFNPEKKLKPQIKNEITSDSSFLSYEAICFACKKEFRFSFFIGWAFFDGLSMECSIEEIADLS